LLFTFKKDGTLLKQCLGMSSVFAVWLIDWLIVCLFVCLFVRLFVCLLDYLFVRVCLIVSEFCLILSSPDSICSLCRIV
jgi:hypothetical protein